MLYPLVSLNVLDHPTLILTLCRVLLIYTPKNPIKDPWPEPSHRRRKGKAKERPKDKQPAGTKKKK
jgi:hypothetical protein